MLKRIFIFIIITQCILLIIFFTVSKPQNLNSKPNESQVALNQAKTFEELVTTEADIQNSNKKIFRLLAPVLNGTSEFELTPELKTSLIKRKKQMYYLARSSPELFLKHLFHRDIQFYLPTNLMEEENIELQGNLMFDTAKQTWYILSPFDYTKTHLYHGLTRNNFKQGAKAQVIGTKIEDRLVLNNKEGYDMLYIDEFMNNH